MAVETLATKVRLDTEITMTAPRRDPTHMAQETPALGELEAMEQTTTARLALEDTDPRLGPTQVQAGPETHTVRMMMTPTPARLERMALQTTAPEMMIPTVLRTLALETTTTPMVLQTPTRVPLAQTRMALPIPA